MSEVCRDFGISRKTGYKIFNRYRDQELDALTDRSRRPVRYANQLPAQLEQLIVDLKRDKPHWGARKIRELLVRKLAPATCTCLRPHGRPRVDDRRVISGIIHVIREWFEMAGCSGRLPPVEDALRRADGWSSGW